MPALAFGLKTAKPQSGFSKPTQKRKAVFDNEPEEDEAEEEEEEEEDAFSGLQKPKIGGPKSKPNLETNKEPPRKSPKLSGAPSHSAGNSSSKYTNLSALRSAKLQDEEASKVDSSVYDYDAVYDTFHAVKEKKPDDEQSSGPKYMTSLMESAEVRKRDQLRARDKMLQKERDAEGDEFADKEKFVTSAYKKQQEELRKMEEEEKKREEEEEQKRRKGGGMTEFNKNLLRREEERQRQIEEATEEAKRRKDVGGKADGTDAENADGEVDENKMAAELNAHGGRIVVNDEGEVVDKRQLLGAGLNVAPKKPGTATSQTKKTTQADRPQEWRRSEKAQEARMGQRERQSRMMERQLEEMAEKQRQAEEKEQNELEEKNKSKLTEASKMSAKERYLQRKKEREEQAKKG